MYYVELNGYEVFSGSLSDCKHAAKLVREFLTKYKYYPVDTFRKRIELDEVYCLCVSMYSIEF